MLTIANEIVYVGPVATVEETLPSDVTDEVLVIIAPTSFSCGPGLGPATVSNGLLIDDLRLE